MADITADDLRAAVASGTITEIQAVNLLATAQTRAGLRQAEDEPFELFKGFAEIFVAIGLSILITGMAGLAALSEGFGIILIVYAGLAWIMAHYFTLKRRMILPSIILASAFAAAIVGSGIWLIDRIWGNDDPDMWQAVFVLAATGLGLIAWYRRFRLPFAMFLLGLTSFGIAIVLSSNADDNALWFGDMSQLFDLRMGSSLPFGTLVFGLAALAGGMWFDTRDPHRLGRNAASGFWLHILAAPALVNTVAMTFYNMGPGLGYGLLALSLLLVSVLALVIDRRSFLTAGIGYLIFLLGYVITDPTEPGSWVVVIFLVGLGLTWLGTFWTQMRTRLMRLLPNFPGKTRLPPYTLE